MKSIVCDLLNRLDFQKCFHNILSDVLFEKFSRKWFRTFVWNPSVILCSKKVIITLKEMVLDLRLAITILIINFRIKVNIQLVNLIFIRSSGNYNIVSLMQIIIYIFFALLPHLHSKLQQIDIIVFQMTHGLMVWVLILRVTGVYCLQSLL